MYLKRRHCQFKYDQHIFLGILSYPCKRLTKEIILPGRRFGQIAQLVEHGPEKAGVRGSSPRLTTSFLYFFFLPVGFHLDPKFSRKDEDARKSAASTLRQSKLL